MEYRQIEMGPSCGLFALCSAGIAEFTSLEEAIGRLRAAEERFGLVPGKRIFYWSEGAKDQVSADDQTAFLQLVKSRGYFIIAQVDEDGYRAYDKMADHVMAVVKSPKWINFPAGSIVWQYADDAEEPIIEPVNAGIPKIALYYRATPTMLQRQRTLKWAWAFQPRFQPQIGAQA